MELATQDDIVWDETGTCGTIATRNDGVYTFELDTSGAGNPREDFENGSHFLTWAGRSMSSPDTTDETLGTTLRSLLDLCPLDAMTAFLYDERIPYGADDSDDLAAFMVTHVPIDGIMGFVSRYMPIRPVFCLDHSGVSVSTHAFNDPWDSGFVGLIYMTPDETRERYVMPSHHVLTREELDRAASALDAEVTEYNAWMNGDVWGYSHDYGDGRIDSCYGFLVPEGDDMLAVMDIAIDRDDIADGDGGNEGEELTRTSGRDIVRLYDRAGKEAPNDEYSDVIAEMTDLLVDRLGLSWEEAVSRASIVVMEDEGLTMEDF